MENLENKNGADDVVYQIYVSWATFFGWEIKSYRDWIGY